jgi:hypothetical protein
MSATYKPFRILPANPVEPETVNPADVSGTGLIAVAFVAMVVISGIYMLMYGVT